MNSSELIGILFWIDEFTPGIINLFQLETYPGEKSTGHRPVMIAVNGNRQDIGGLQIFPIYQK